MSSLIVEVCEVQKVEDHPQADRLAIAVIKGWRSCIRKVDGVPEFQVGEKVVYFPPDSVLPEALANKPTDNPPGRLGIMNYLASLPNGEKGGRVKSARLRGQRSEGFIMKIDPQWGDDPEWPVGTDVKEHYGVKKWEPPVTATDGDAAPPHPRFHHYTDIERIQNFPGVIAEGEEVVITEKLHGKNCRIGMILDNDDAGNAVWTLMAGSHSVRRKEFDAKGRRSDFWEVITEPVKKLLTYLASDEFVTEDRKSGIVLFGEIIGPGVQDLAYGQTGKTLRVFDIAINHTYLGYDAKAALCQAAGVEMVPLLYRGPFSDSIVEQYTSGPTTMCPPDKAGKFKGREGIVITPAVERDNDPVMNLSSTHGRVILKSISVDYEDRKGGTDGH